MEQAKVYAAGPLWRTGRDGPQKVGEVVPEASKLRHVQRLVNRRRLVEVPRGHWIYKATGRYKGVPTGSVVTDITNPRILARLVRLRYLERVDSADLNGSGDAKEPEKVPALDSVAQRARAMQTEIVEPVKKPGRPKGSKDKVPRVRTVGKIGK